MPPPPGGARGVRASASREVRAADLGRCRSAVRDIVWRAWPLKPISRSPPPPPSAGRCAGCATASPSTSPRPPSCSPPAASSWTSCSAAAARVRDAGLVDAGPAGCRHLLPQGVHPAHAAVPRPLPLLHVRHRAAPPARRVPRARRGAGDRPGRARRRAARRRCSPSATGPRSAGPPRASGWRPAATTPRWSTCAPARSRCWRRPGLLPHLNPGVMSWEELTRLKPVAPSMGMMLETTATRLWSEPGGPHYGSPDKEPAVRLRTLTDAGRVGVPFTTGILIGIGENRVERAESLFAIRAAARAHGHVQETIVQNFRAKPDTAMANDPDADLDDLAATIAVARLVLGPKMRLQAPPNLVGDEFALMLRAGHRRLGRRLAGHGGPRQPRAAVARDRRARRPLRRGRVHAARAAHGVPAVRAGRLAVDRRPAARARRRAGRPRPVSPGRTPSVVGRPWQEPDGGFASTGRIDLQRDHRHGRAAPTDRRGDFASVYGDWDSLREELDGRARHRGERPERLGRRRPRRARARRRPTPRRCSTPPTPTPRMALILAEGPALEELAAARRRPAPRRRRRRGHLRRQPQHQLLERLLRGLPVLRLRPARARRRRLPALARRGRRARGGGGRAGATEVCMQGGIDPQLPVTFYADLVRAVRAAVPGMHVHAFSPMEIVSAAAKAGVSIEEWLTELRDGRARLDPRHGGGDPRRRGPLGAHQGQAAGGAVGGGRVHRAPAGHPVELDDDVRPRRRAAALARAPAHARRGPGRDRRLHRVRAAAVRAPQRADLPRRAGPAGADRARQPRRARVRPAGAARADRPRAGVVGQARRRAGRATSCAAAPTTWAAR